MPIAVNCPKCSKPLRVPDATAGKNVKCPGCQSSVAVPASNATASPPAAKLAVKPPTKPPAIAKSATVAQAPLSFDEDLLGERDFEVSGVGSAQKKGGGHDHLEGIGDVEPPRPEIYYSRPGLITTIVFLLNLIAAIVIVVMVVMKINKIEEPVLKAREYALDAMAMKVIWGVFAFGVSFHGALGGFRLMNRTRLGSVKIAAIYLVLAPFIVGAGAYFLDNQTALIVFGVLLALLNWPMAGWVSSICNSKKTREDFGELERGDLDEEARQLSRKAAGFGGH